MLIVFNAVGLGFAICVKEDLKRLKYEKSLAFESNSEGEKFLTSEGKTSNSDAILSCQESKYKASDDTLVDSNNY